MTITPNYDAVQKDKAIPDLVFKTYTVQKTL
jgi:hypothetical protein